MLLLRHIMEWIPTRLGHERRENALVEKMVTMDRLAVGQGGLVSQLRADDETNDRLLALGFVPGGRVEAVQESPWGDPVAYRVCGAVIALRRADARRITVERWN